MSNKKKKIKFSKYYFRLQCLKQLRYLFIDLDYEYFFHSTLEILSKNSIL